ncbi:hypothetical protein GFC30_414 [Anoxybacillus amylolyticus]|uniref:Uncharacterized protein n=1 Tax=Anoxybacteroides amylolyticum TaxID=294699 RepID=A0A160F548_9BACL|nr:hypothetical protein GFC30_414 [Anoxybacillus amylolyticus]
MENTMSNRDPALTVSVKLVTIPLAFCNRVSGKEMFGDNVTRVLGIAVNILLEGELEI